MGYDSTAVHLAVRTEHGYDCTKRDELRRICVLGVFHVPEIFVDLGLSRYDLAAIGDQSASHSEDEVDVVVPSQSGALLHLCVCGVGHYAGELHDMLSTGIQDPDDLVIHTVSLDGTAA